MSDALTEWLASEGLGDLKQSLPLSGVMTIDGKDAAPHLVRTQHGVWIAAIHDDRGIAVSVSPETRVRYLRGVVRDGIESGDGSFTVPLGSGGTARQCIALGRLAAAADGKDSPRFDAGNPLVESSLGPVAAAWLAGFLEEGEVLLAWLDTKTSTQVPSPLTDSDETLPWTWLFTDRRSLLVALGDLGDARTLALEGPMRVDERYGPDRVLAGQEEFWTLNRNDLYFQQLAAVHEADRDPRLVHVAKLHAVSGRKGADRVAQDLLRRVAPTYEGGVYQVVLSLIDPGDDADPVQALIRCGDALDPDWILGLREHWNFDAGALVGVLDALVVAASPEDPALVATVPLRLRLQGSPLDGGAAVIGHLAKAHAWAAFGAALGSEGPDTLDTAEGALRAQRGVGPLPIARAISQLADFAAVSPGVLAAAALLEAQSAAGSDARPLAVAAHIDALQTLRDRDELLSWFVEWELDAEVGRALVAALGTDPDALVTTLGLHRTVHERLVADCADSPDRVGPDLDLAEHLWLIEKDDEAEVVLAAALEVLPVDGATMVLNNPRHDPGQLDPIEALRVIVLEKLVVIGGERERPDFAPTLELARLEPLNPSRMATLVDAADGAARDRAQEVLALYQRGGLRPAEVDPPEHPVHPLPSEAMEQVRHPLAGVEGYQSWLSMVAAKSPVDLGPLRRFSERVTRRNRETLSNALSDGFNLLQMRAFPAFVSAGELGYGVRAQAEEGGLILIGGLHLQPEDPRYMTDPELRFAIGAELAHVRFQHPRATSEEMRQGAWDTAVGTVKFVGSMALMVSGPLSAMMAKRGAAQEVLKRFVPLSMATRLTGETDGRKVWSALNTRAAGWITQGKTYVEKGQSAVGGLQTAQEKVSELKSDAFGAEPEDEGSQVASLSPAQRELYFMYRVTQLTADRAGLVLCGDLRAAVRAMFLLDQESAAQFEAAERGDLIGTLRHRDEDGSYHFGWLAVRVASLVRFYLSPEYAALRELAATAESDGPP